MSSWIRQMKRTQQHADENELILCAMRTELQGVRGVLQAKLLLKRRPLGLSTSSDSGPDVGVNAQDKFGRTALHWAARTGDERCVSEIIDFPGTKCDIRDKDGRTPLHEAAIMGHISIIKMLLGNATVRELLELGDHHQRTALHWAADNNDWLAMQELLVAGGADASKEDENGETALHRAARHGDEAILENFVGHKGVTDGLMASASRTASNSGRKKAAVKLLQLMTTMEYADAEYAAERAIEARMDLPNLLIWASENGRCQLVKVLLEQNAGLVARDASGNTPLFIAARRGHGDVVRVLLEEAVDRTERDAEGNTPLWVAVCEGHVNVVQVFLDNGADVDEPNSKRETPLMEAVRRGHSNVVRVLLENNANVEARDYSRFPIGGESSPLCMAVWQKQDDIVQQLLAKNANTEILHDRRTPLLQAADKGYTDIVRMLLESNADTEAQTFIEQTSINLAAKGGHADVVELLLAHKAKIDHKNSGHHTALMDAVEQGHANVVELLIQRGSTIPFDWCIETAEKRGQGAIIKLIRATEAEK
ncbi:Ankyrin repeat-containing domain protein [Metarhizium rileyi]|uniref:Ankyrin repeat-containing domain protein n=1 Tax=Metarhizium rileyi (strain RCEF 4871) TaxID=1649241 RepID=A0A167I492_METRR|nr:Ankyrin repeat-containing domain protein [Metarhizium rileyi RCEF 4871]